LHGGAIRYAAAPDELLDRYRSDPAWFLQGVALGMDRHCRAVVISAAPGALRVNNSTSRANHRHIFIVARIKPAPENPLRAF
jgi:hypothetical protein